MKELNIKVKYIESLVKTVKVLIVSAVIVQTVFSSSVSVFAEGNSSTSGDDENSSLNTSSALISEAYVSLDELLRQARYLHNPGAHGFAAEEANNLIDNLTGQKAEVIGYDNAAAGADRKITLRNGTEIYIQDKYYSTAKGSVDACFADDGNFKYLTSDGDPMQIEVPSDQYDEAVKLMREKITDGKVPGVTDPDEAESIVRKGNITYDQAVKLTKAGTFESLTYDAKTGAVTAACAFGISTAMNFAIRMYNGEEREEALKESAKSGIVSGVETFGITVISLQLAKTGVVTVFQAPAQAIVDTFGDDFAKALASSAGKNVPVAEASKQAVKILQNDMLVASVSAVVLNVPNFVRYFEGKISAKQLIKNFAEIVAGVAGSTAGQALGSTAGSAVLPGVGTYAGGFVGAVLIGALAQYGTSAILDIFVEDDAQEMLDIVQDEFSTLCEEHMLTADESSEITDQIKEKLDANTLYEMYASDDRNAFAKNLLEPIFDNFTTANPIAMASAEEMRYATIEDYGETIYIH